MPEKNTTRSSMVPAMRYRNAPAAIEWLCRVFGFEKHAVYRGPDNTIAHAELTLGSGMIMLGSINDNDYSRFIKQPDDIGGAEKRSTSLIVSDAGAICARAKKPVQILFDIEEKPYGGRTFTCRDIQGHIWDIGTYYPWQQK